MADYTTAAAALESALNSAATGGMVESYASSEGNSARLGKATDQIAALSRLEGLKARRAAGGLLYPGRLVNPTN